MTLPRSVADVLADHVTLEVECIDRMYLNLYVPKLQYATGVVGFFKGHRKNTFASFLPSPTSSARRRLALDSRRARRNGSN
jgi:hypothetical protein